MGHFSYRWVVLVIGGWLLVWVGGSDGGMVLGIHRWFFGLVDGFWKWVDSFWDGCTW